MRTFDKKKTEGKCDESKSEEVFVAQNKQGTEYETETPTLSELSSDEEKEIAITKLTVEDSKSSQDFENQGDAIVEVIGSIEEDIEKKMDDKENQIGITKQPIVPNTEEEDQEEGECVTGM